MLIGKSLSLVSADWLKTNLSGVQVLDATWHLPAQGRDARAEFEAERIASAIFIDIDEVSDGSPGPPSRMLPPPEKFARKIGKLGLEHGRHIVVYDRLGLYSAARVWWMFRIYGYEAVSVLDGGLPAWKRADGPTELGPTSSLPVTDWPIEGRCDLVRTWQELRDNLASNAELVVDVRPPAMFNGDTSNLYPGVRAGHIPGAINLSQRLLLHQNATFKPLDEVASILRGAGLMGANSVVATCGSGVTACILSLAMDLVMGRPCPVYDGSWEEWGNRQDLPVQIDRQQSSS